MLSVYMLTLLINLVGEMLWGRRLAVYIISRDSDALIFKAILKSPNKFTFLSFSLVKLTLWGL